MSDEKPVPIKPLPVFSSPPPPPSMEDPAVVKEIALLKAENAKLRADVERLRLEVHNLDDCHQYAEYQLNAALLQNHELTARAEAAERVVRDLVGDGKCPACGTKFINFTEKPKCEHQWVDARNEIVKSGELCLKCHAIRAGNATTDLKRINDCPSTCEKCGRQDASVMKAIYGSPGKNLCHKCDCE